MLLPGAANPMQIICKQITNSKSSRFMSKETIYTNLKFAFKFSFINNNKYNAPQTFQSDCASQQICALKQ